MNNARWTPYLFEVKSSSATQNDTDKHQCNNVYPDVLNSKGDSVLWFVSIDMTTSIKAEQLSNVSEINLIIEQYTMFDLKLTLFWNLISRSVGHFRHQLCQSINWIAQIQPQNESK